MKNLIGLLAVSCGLNVSAAVTNYVDASNTSPVYPYTNWMTAASTIQDAVDAAHPSNTVLVANGIYDSGAFARPGGSSLNRVLVTNSITITSVNGADHTFIVGEPDPVTGGLGSDAVRCVYMTDGSISGFTLTNGYANAGGDIYKDRSGGGINLAAHPYGSVSNCVIIGNHANWSGGGIHDGTAVDCTITDNFSLNHGGGMSSVVATNCVVTFNDAGLYGGGAYGSVLHNSALNRNTASHGAGMMEGAMYNCTVAGNSSSGWAGGTFRTFAQNCIVWGNEAEVHENYFEGQFHYSCTTPLASGYDNIDLDPQLIDFVHISETSPCIGGGETNSVYSTNLLAQTVDIDGEPWLATPAMGCDEIIPGTSTGSLSVAIHAAVTNAVEGSSLAFTAEIEGRATSNVWNVAGLSATNQSSVAHTWPVPGSYDVELTAFNEDWPLGVAATVTVSIVDMASVSTHYVNVGNDTPAWPYDSWATAATTIQDAVDAAESTGMVGACVWVTNGVYDTGSRAVDGYTSLNRVLIKSDISVQSVNGAEQTIIVGAEGVDGGNGVGAVRCVYMLAGSLSGFTLTNGYTLVANSSGSRDQSGGGVNAYDGSDVVISNCIVTGCSSTYYGGGIFGGAVFDCSVSNNTAYIGGGLGICSPVENTTVSHNSAISGGGTYYADMEHCVVSHNTATGDGGGIRSGTVRNTLIAYNKAASEGGGAEGGAFYNCTFSHNRANIGAGAARGLGLTLYGCAITDNIATNGAGGVQTGTLEQCTVARNQSEAGAGGVQNCNVRSSIVWDNTSVSGTLNIAESSVSYSCSTPLPAGEGNIDAHPQFVGTSSIAAWSPCVGAGQDVALSYTDLDGEAWMPPPSMGCDEIHSGSLTGNLNVAISAADSQVLEGASLSLEGLIDGRAASVRWSFDDGAELLDALQVEHTWNTAGTYDVVLRAYNDDWPLGVATTTTVTVLDLEAHGTYYVDAASATPAWPYQSWATAATTIQDGVNASAAGLPGGQVLVTNGIYASGVSPSPDNTGTNRLVITNLVSVVGVNGAKHTFIEGETNDIRCVYMSTGSLSGFTLTNGHTTASGGGVDCAPESSAIISNCVIIGCSAAVQGGGVNNGTVYNSTIISNAAGQGGGVSDAIVIDCELLDNVATGGGGGAQGGALNGTLVAGNQAANGGGLDESVGIDCVVSNNIASSKGGGANNCELFDSTVVTNSASDGGGIYQGSASNCVISLNHAQDDGGGAFSSTLVDCTVSTNSAVFDGGGMAYYLSYATRCTFIGNTAGSLGGGTRQAELESCLLIGNSATDGGGAFSGSATNCLFYDNHATARGGGAAYMDLINCTVADNTCDGESGGVFMTVHSDIDNSIIYHNSAPVNPDLNPIGIVTYSCISIEVPGLGNITNAPVFTGLGNYRLSVVSSCINAGDNAKVSGSADFDGNARIYDGIVDMGCYEAFDDGSDSDGDNLTDWDEARSHGSNPWKPDSDGDGSNDGDEWFIGSNLLDSNSVFMVSMESTTNDVTFSWPIFNPGLRYKLMGRTNLVEGSWQFKGTTISSNLVRSATDDTMFYRIEVITND